MSGQPEFQKTLSCTSEDVIQWPWAQLVYDSSGASESVPYLIMGYHALVPPTDWQSLPYDISGMRKVGLDFHYVNPPDAEYVGPVALSVQVSGDGSHWSTLDVIVDPLVGDGDSRHIDLTVTSHYIRVVATPRDITDRMDINVICLIGAGET
jgi:hypothetical protein